MDIKKMLSEKNVGNLDKNVRLALGTILAVAGIINSSIIVTLAGAALLITGIRGNCGAYSILGINTCKLDKK